MFDIVKHLLENIYCSKFIHLSFKVSKVLSLVHLVTTTIALLLDVSIVTGYTTHTRGLQYA